MVEDRRPSGLDLLDQCREPLLALHLHDGLGRVHPAARRRTDARIDLVDLEERDAGREDTGCKGVEVNTGPVLPAVQPKRVSFPEEFTAVGFTAVEECRTKCPLPIGGVWVRSADGEAPLLTKPWLVDISGGESINSARTPDSAGDMIRRRLLTSRR